MSASSEHPPILCYLETHVRVPLSGGVLDTVVMLPAKQLYLRYRVAAKKRD